jgi:hypothetical protein
LAKFDNNPPDDDLLKKYNSIKALGLAVEKLHYELHQISRLNTAKALSDAQQQIFARIQNQFHQLNINFVVEPEVFTRPFGQTMLKFIEQARLHYNKDKKDIYTLEELELLHMLVSFNIAEPLERELVIKDDMPDQWVQLLFQASVDVISKSLPDVPKFKLSMTIFFYYCPIQAIA